MNCSLIAQTLDTHSPRHHKKGEKKKKTNDMGPKKLKGSLWLTVFTFIGSICCSVCKWLVTLGSNTLPMKLYTCAKSGIAV